MKHGNVVGIAGWSGSGKTALIVKLIPELAARGLRVATIKHAHHQFDIDKPGKDSYEHRIAGAAEVAISSARRWAIVHENRGDPEPTLDEMLDRISAADIVLVEGYKTEPHRKIEVWRRATGKPPLFPDDPNVVALATDETPPPTGISVLDLNNVPEIAAFVVGLAQPAGKTHGAIIG